MNCADARPRLEEYHDRELDPRDAEAVRSHLAGCAACASEVASLESLDRTLKSASKRADDVAWDRYVDRVRERTRASRPFPMKALVPLAAAAAVLLAVTLALSDEGSLLDQYAAASPPERLRLERSVAKLDRESLATLAGIMVGDPDPARRRLAAQLLSAQLNDPAIRDLVLARSRASEDEDSPEEVVLIDIGFEPGDEELVVPALEMARSPANFEDAMRILRRLDRGTLNRKVHAEIVKRLRELLASDLPRDRDLAVRVAGALEILIEDVVEFLDVPGLGGRVLEFLRRRTGQDFGTDKDAWRNWFARKEM